MKLRRVGVALVVASVLPLVFSAAGGAVGPSPNPVATTEAEYLAFGRVFSDPQGCLTQDVDGDGVNDVVPPGVSPWAKGNMCMAQFLSYQEAIDGTNFLAQRFPRFLEVIRLDQAYDNANFRSAGIPRAFSTEDGTVQAIDRDRRPLYLFKVTDSQSPIPESMRLHFVYAGSIHGIERAGAEGSLRAMEDLVTWGANDPGKRLVETETAEPVPTVADTLARSVIYFMLPNPDGWARGQVQPAELEDGSPNLSYTPGVFYQRYNGNGMDMNRDWPGVGYTYRPYSPGSEPEVRAYMSALRAIRATISPSNPVGQRFAGGIDLHGQLTANAFSFTLLGAGQRDFRKNFSTVDQGLRTWADQTARMEWSPYIGTVFEAADQWGTVIDTLGYQVSGALGDWIENEEIGLGAVGIDNEMSLSHLAPNNVFDPTTEQMHVDGNKGLIYSQLASMLTEEAFRYEPTGRIGYVLNPRRIEQTGASRPPNPGLPAQNDLDVILPCQSATAGNVDAALPCKGGTFALDGTSYNLEFDVKGPGDGIWNGGITATLTNANALGISPGTLSRLSLQRFDEDSQAWENAATAFVQAGSPDAYLQSGQIATVNDPMPGRWRARVTSAGGTGLVRVKIDFNPVTAEESPGQAAFSASSMDFFTDLNKYIADPNAKAKAVTAQQIAANPKVLDGFDSLVVVNSIGNRAFLTDAAGGLGLTQADADAYFAGLRRFAAQGGNLVLTDAALAALEQIGAVPAGEVHTGLASTTSRGQAASYNFDVPGRGNVCNADALLIDVCLPGTAGGSSRVAVEPTPLGYPPDGTLDNDPAARLRQWWVGRSAWEAGCGKPSPAECTSALMLAGDAGIGERNLGEGVVRIVGAMFPDPSFTPGGPRDMRFGLQSYALSFSAWQVFLNLVDYQRPLRPDLTVTAITTGSKVVDGSTALITATVANSGTGEAAASTTAFVLDGQTTLGSVATPAVPAGGAVQVSVPWSTKGVKGEHTIRATADAAGVLNELDAANNAAVLTVSVKANKVKNGSFEQASSSGAGPEGWTAAPTSAGTTSWSQDGESGSKGVTITGTGRSAALAGSPSWTSDAVAVQPGEVVDLSVLVKSTNASSAPSVSLVYLGAAGLILDTVYAFSAPLTTAGFAALERAVSIPSGVTAVRIALSGFAPTDTRTSGSVTFDQVGLYSR